MISVLSSRSPQRVSQVARSGGSRTSAPASLLTLLPSPRCPLHWPGEGPGEERWGGEGHPPGSPPPCAAPPPFPVRPADLVAFNRAAQPLFSHQLRFTSFPRKLGLLYYSGF